MRESKLSPTGWRRLEEPLPADGDTSFMRAWSSGGEDAAVCRSTVKLMLMMLKELRF